MSELSRLAYNSEVDVDYLSCWTASSALTEIPELYNRPLRKTGINTDLSQSLTVTWHRNIRSLWTTYATTEHDRPPRRYAIRTVLYCCCCCRHLLANLATHSAGSIMMLSSGVQHTSFNWQESMPTNQSDISATSWWHSRQSRNTKCTANESLMKN